MWKSYDKNTLKSLVLKHFPEAEDNLTFQQITTGKFNTSYIVKCSNRELVLRIAPPRNIGLIFYEKDMMSQEPAIHNTNSRLLHFTI